MHPAGWYKDPQDASRVRWWDGSQWTQHSQPVSGELEEVASLQKQLAALREELVETTDAMMLQEVGLYAYRHPLQDSAAYKDALKELQGQIKASVREKKAVEHTSSWAINGSLKEGAKMVSDFSKLLLRAYNNEAETTVRGMKPYALPAAQKRLDKSRATISRLGARMKIAIAADYHSLRAKELELTADYLAMKAAEKEAEREERARLREEKAALKELEREKERLRKEAAHYENAMKALREKGDEDGAARLEEKLAEINEAVAGVVERAANRRAGYVYVISNLGSFGSNIIKIGMTRRLDPMDRVRELGDASVPFRFDAHALFFDKDAVDLESRLHRRFAHRRVNLINRRREYFYATPSEVRDVLLEECPNLLTFVEDAAAEEFRQSEASRRTSIPLIDAQPSASGGLS